MERGDAGDLSAIIALLRSDADFGPDARDLVADLLSRHRLAKRKGGQANKAYKITLNEGKQRMAVKLVAYYRERGLSQEQAMSAALRDEKRDQLEIRGDPQARTYTDDAVDEMISDQEIDLLENRLKRGRK